MTSPAPQGLPPDSATLTLNMTQAGQQCVVVLGAKQVTDGVVDTADAEAWAAAAWSKLVQPVVAGEVLATTATVRTSGGAAIDVPVVGGASGGNGGTGGVVAAACALIKWSSASGTRSGKGRTFLPGLPATAVVGGRTYAAAYRTSVQTAINNYLADTGLAGAGLDPAVLSRSKQATYVITAGALAPVVGIQRRRMR